MVDSEKQFAAFLTARGKTWKAQPHTFKIGDDAYRPDFYCFEDGVYYEVKTQYDVHSIRKVIEFRKIYPHLKIKIVNPDGSCYHRSTSVPYLEHLKKTALIFETKDMTELSKQDITYLKKYALRIRGVRQPWLYFQKYQTAADDGGKSKE